MDFLRLEGGNKSSFMIWATFVWGFSYKIAMILLVLIYLCGFRFNHFNESTESYNLGIINKNNKVLQNKKKRSGFVCTCGFESQAHHLRFSIYIVQIVYLSFELECEKNKNEQKEVGIGPFVFKKEINRRSKM